MNILFVQSGKTSLSEMLPLGRYLHQKEKYRCYLTSSKKNVESLLNEEQLDDFHMVSLDLYAKKRSTVISKIPIISKVFKIKERIKLCKNLLKDLKIDIVLLYCDFNASDELCYIKACNAVGINSVLLPIAVSNPSFMAKHRIDKKKNLVLKGIKKLFIQKVFPFQAYSFNEQSVLFYSFYMMFKLFINGVLPKNPWIMGGGDSNYVLVQSENIKDNLIKHHVECEKVLVTGQFTTDSMYKSIDERENLKDMINDKYYLNKKNKILIFALPQFSEHGLMSKDKHHMELEYILKQLNNFNINVLCSLHPKMSCLDYEYLEKNNQCKLLEERLSDVLSCADYYVGCFESTTVWAYELRIPSLFINYFDLGYNMEYLKDLVINNEKENLLKDCKLLFEQTNNFKRNYGFIDGNSGKRIIQALTQIYSENKGKSIGKD